MGDYGRTRRPDRMARLRTIIYMVLVVSSHITLSNSRMRVRTPKSHEDVRSKVRVTHRDVHSKARVSPISENLLRLDRHSDLIEQAGNRLSVKDCPSDCQCVLMSRGNQTALGVLNCKYDPYDALPQLFDSHKKITQLGITNCHLSRLPPEIVKLPLLIVVVLYMNEFTEIPRVLLELPQLEQLFVDYNKLSYLPAYVTTLSTLKVLQLGHNMISELPEAIGGMRNLQILNLTRNELQSIPQSIGELSQLLQLYISNNSLHSLPQGIGKLSQLQWLDVSHNDLQSLPQIICTLSQLVVLDISYSKLRSLPAEVGKLTELKGLFASNNKLKTLPSQIGGMNSLIALRLQDNDITILPNETTQLKQLKTVTLSNNPLGVVPTLPTESLTEVFCDNCSIQTIPCTMFTAGHLQHLVLNYNSIKSADCGEIVSNSMSKFRLAHNSLQDMPCGSQFGNLVEIVVSHNHISTLPKQCKLLTDNYLERIFFHYNEIDTFHFSSFCTEQTSGKLRVLVLLGNRISTIDTSDCPLQQCFSPHAIIQLQGNRLSVLDSWPMLLSQHKSITIDVSDNNLSQFTSSARGFLPASQYGTVFYMGWNQIKHFMDVFNGWKVIVNTTEDLNTVMKNAYFSLGYNPLVCDCVDYEVYRNIQRLRTEKYNALVCHEPKSLRGQNPSHIPLGDFVCDLDVNCPNGCTCTKVPHSQTINVTCVSYNETDIPEVMPNLPKQNYEYRLDMCHQNLHEITFRPYLVKTIEIRLSNNSVTAIKINSSNVFRRVKILHIDNNLLQRLPESVAGMTNESVVEIRLGSNPWVCDCKALTMKNWIMKNWHIVKDKDTIRCHSPPNMVGVKVINIKRSTACPNENKIPAYVVAVLSTVAFILMVSIYCYDKFKFTNWQLVGSDECDGERKEFDIFMCACSAEEDADYVENFLIPELERRDFRVLYHREHFHPGKPIHVNMCEALEKSKRTLVFFSNSYRQSGYSMYEFHSALDLDIQNRTKRLITIKDTNLDMDKLEISEVYYFRKHTYLDRRDVKFWRLLENALPRKRLGAQVRL